MEEKKKRKMKKKRAGDNNNHNPLAAARGRKQQKDKIDQLWHRKSGAGYALFVDYYARQPPGVVCGNDGEGRGIGGSTKQLQQGQCRGRGMSRASRRRKRKRGDDTSNTRQEEVASANTTTTSSSPKGTLHKEPTETYNRLVQEAAAGIAGQLHHNYLLHRFLTTLSKPLPLTFRIRNSILIPPAKQDSIRKELQENYSHLGIAPTPFDDRIYQAATTTTSSSSSLLVSKNNLQQVSPQLKQWLNARSLDGSLARQELGSMLPVFLLHKLGYILTGSRVLDLCASPGSKTLQAAEIVGRTGRVRANDVNPSRLDALKDAVLRSGISRIEAIIKYTNTDAATYKVPPTNNKKYNVVLCDVPCSGDGTCRKDDHILPNWSPNIANALHATQVQILVKGLQCVQVGGVVSYSTCSLNPIENEAVVSAALIQLQLLAQEEEEVDDDGKNPRFQVLQILPVDGLVLRPGVTDWSVADYTGQQTVCSSSGNDDDDDERPRLRWHSSFADATGCGMEHASAGMWPPPPSSSAKDLHNLEGCLRLWPQDQDTGGFFVTFIQRLS